MKAVALTIAGSDPSGGAGIQADLKTFHQFGVYGEAVITLLTVQNTVRVSRVEVMPEGLVLDQIVAVVGGIPPGGAEAGGRGLGGGWGGGGLGLGRRCVAPCGGCRWSQRPTAGCSAPCCAGA